MRRAGERPQVLLVPKQMSLNSRRARALLCPAWAALQITYGRDVVTVLSGRLANRIFSEGGGLGEESWSPAGGVCC